MDKMGGAGRYITIFKKEITTCLARTQMSVRTNVVTTWYSRRPAPDNVPANQ